MPIRAVILAAAALLTGTVQAAENDLLIEGSVLCSNFDPLTDTCRTITAVTKIDGNLRYSRSRRKVALPDESLLLETEGIARVEGLRVCGVRPTAKPRVTPADSKYAAAVLMVHIRKRDFRIKRGDCIIYKPCGSGYHLFRFQNGRLDDKQRSFTTVFRPGDPRIGRITLRDRVFGVPETPPSECEPVS